MATKAALFAGGMRARHAFEATRPRVEVQSGSDRVVASVTDGGHLKLRSSTLISVGSDSSHSVELSERQAYLLAQWILDTFDEPAPPIQPPAPDYAKPAPPIQPPAPSGGAAGAPRSRSAIKDPQPRPEVDDVPF